MEIEDEITIPKTCYKVFKALNDVAILKMGIPRCEELERAGQNDLVEKVTLIIGSVKTRFSGRVMRVQSGYSINFT